MEHLKECLFLLLGHVCSYHVWSPSCVLWPDAHYVRCERVFALSRSNFYPQALSAVCAWAELRVLFMLSPLLWVALNLPIGNTRNVVQYA